MLHTQKALIKIIFIVYCLSNVQNTEQLKGERLGKRWIYHTEYNLVVRGTETEFNFKEEKIVKIIS